LRPPCPPVVFFCPSLFMPPKFQKQSDLQLWFISFSEHCWHHSHSTRSSKPSPSLRPAAVTIGMATTQTSVLLSSAILSSSFLITQFSQQSHKVEGTSQKTCVPSSLRLSSLKTLHIAGVLGGLVAHQSTHLRCALSKGRPFDRPFDVPSSLRLLVMQFDPRIVHWVGCKSGEDCGPHGLLNVPP